MDVQPPVLRRRGDGARRGAELAEWDGQEAAALQLARFGAVERSRFADTASGSAGIPAGLRRSAGGGCRQQLDTRQAQLRGAAVALHRE